MMAPRKPKPAPVVDPGADAQEVYEYAQTRALDARKEWERVGKPYTVVLANGVEAADPMWKVMLEAESQAAKLREKIVPKKPATMGRPVGRASAPDRTAGRPAPLLRAVK